MYALLALYLLEVRGQRGAIVRTLNTTVMLDKLAKRFNVPLYETGVGFKYVAPKIVETTQNHKRRDVLDAGLKLAGLK